MQLLEQTLFLCCSILDLFLQRLKFTLGTDQLHLLLRVFTSQYCIIILDVKAFQIILGCFTSRMFLNIFKVNLVEQLLLDLQIPWQLDNLILKRKTVTKVFLQLVESCKYFCFFHHLLPVSLK
nr:hypothetical protein [uncultured Sphaerochaeta sp.]